MQTLKGNVVFWSVRGFNIPTEELEAALSSLGFDPGEFIPRNNFKSAMIKALKTLNKDYSGLGKRDYERCLDAGNYVTFTVYEVNPTGTDVDLDKQLVFKLDKTHGNIDILSQTTSEAYVQKLREEYNKEKVSLNSTQFSATVLDVVEKEGRGFKMRPGGGVYFMHPSKDSVRLKLKALFEKFPEHMKFNTVPVYSDPDTLDTLQDASLAYLTQDIETLKGIIERDIRSGALTPRKWKAKKEAADSIVEKLALHGEFLRTEAAGIESKLSGIKQYLQDTTAKVESETVDPEDFIKLLEDL